MAELKKSFSEFHDCIVLHDSKEENLTSSREANRSRIRKYFQEELKQKQPDFFQQGSFSINTTVNPIEGEYDIDDGVYLRNLDENFLNGTDAKIVHGWISEAVKDATKARVEDKNNCVRITYAHDYHIDFPIFGVKDDKYYLASKKDGWKENDIKGFKSWFHDKLKSFDEQLRRNIRYLKAWADYNGYKNITGVLITILVCENQVNNSRDDQSLVSTTGNIATYIRTYRSVCMPVAPFDNLLAQLSSTEIDEIISAFENLYTLGTKAINEKNLEEAYKLWVLLFGDRFKLFDKEEKKEEKKDHPVIITNPPRPWGM